MLLLRWLPSFPVYQESHSDGLVMQPQNGMSLQGADPLSWAKHRCLFGPAIGEFAFRYSSSRSRAVRGRGGLAKGLIAEQKSLNAERSCNKTPTVSRRGKSLKKELAPPEDAAPILRPPSARGNRHSSQACEHVRSM